LVELVLLVLLVGGVHQQPDAKAYHVPEGASWMMHGSGKSRESKGVLEGMVGGGRRRVRRR
jgi:hypothetical protein